MSQDPVERQRLVDLLKANRVDEARSALGDAPHAADLSMVGCAAARLQGDAGAALTFADRALEQSGRSPRVLAQAARTLLTGSCWGLPATPRADEVWRLVPQAIVFAREAVTLEPGLAQAWATLGEAYMLLGHTRDARDAFGRAVAASPGDPGLRRRVIRDRVADGDLQGAADLLPDALAAAPDDVDLRRLQVSVLLGQERHEDARAALASVVAQDPTCWPWAAPALVAAGDPVGAERALPVDGATAYRARFAMWRGEFEAARALAHATCAVDPENGLARLVLGGVAVRSGAPRDAIAELDLAEGLLARPASSTWLGTDEVLAWRAEARLAIGDRVGAARDAVSGLTHTERYHVIAHALRLMAVADPSHGDANLDAWAWRPIASKLEDLLPSSTWSGRQGDVLAGLRCALDKFGGNRSSTPTVLQDGALRARLTPPHPRHEARAAQHGLRHGPIEPVLDAYAAIRARFPDDPVARTYTGELLLWLGRYDDAAPHFDTAIDMDRTTVWAWIGRGACDLLRHSPAEALARWEEGVRVCRFEGPTLFPLRAQAKWQLGDRAGALADLDKALASKPQRVSAWILRALVGGEPAGISRTALAVRRTVPGLWLESCTAVGADPGDVTDALAPLSAALDLSRGNRSSTMLTWFAPDGSGPRVAFCPRAPGRAKPV